MNLTYLQYQLSHHGMEKTQIQRRKNYQISSWELYDSQRELREGRLYVSESAGTNAAKINTEAAPFLVINADDEEDMPKINGIYLYGNHRLSRVLTELNTIFQDYEKWKFGLLYSEGMPLENLLELSGPVLHMPLTIVNKEFHFLAKNAMYRDLFDSDTVEDDELDSIIWTDEFKDCSHRKGVFHYYLPDARKDLLCYNIVLNNRFYARILGSVEDAAYAEVQEQLFERLALCIENIFCAQKVTVHPFTKSREFCDTIKGLLDGQRPADDTVLRQNGWYTSNQYQIIVFRCSGFFPLEEGSQYLYRQLSNIFPEGCVLEKDQDFVCVRNLGNGLEDDGDFRERLAVFLREHVVKAGLGNVFAGTENFALYLSQAYDALRLGERKNPHFWSYNFESYAFDYLLGQCVCRYSPREVIAPELKKILEADREKGTDYYNTLRVYLESGCSASRSAEKLYIHRSSLMKRLGKIETFTGIDLENPDTRLYLLLSFKLLDYEK